MSPDTLVRALERDPSFSRVSHLIIRRERAGYWSLTVSYAGLSRVHPADLAQGSDVGRDHTAQVDLDRIPEGVAVRAWERDPDLVLRLPEPAGDVKAAVHRAIGALAESGLMGSPLEVERHDPASPAALAHDPWPRWHIRRGAGGAG